MKKMLNRALTGSFAIVLVFAMAACSGAPAGGSSGTSAPSATTTPPVDSSASAAPTAEEPVTLRIVTHMDFLHMPAVFDNFMARYPNITIEYEVGQNVDSGVYSVVLSEPDCADIFLLGSGASRIMPLAESGLVEDLTDVYSARGWDKRVPADTINILKATSKGRIYEVSNGMDVFTFKYFKDDFEALGLEPPKTYEDFWNILKTIKDSGCTPMMLGVKDGSPGGHMMSVFWQAIGGQEFVTDMLYGDTPFTDPRSIEAANEYFKLLEMGYINDDCTALDSAEQGAAYASRTGGYVIIHNTVTGLDRFADEGLDLSNIGSFVMPNKDPNKAAAPIAGLAQTWVVASGSQNKEAAYTFLDYIVSPEYTQTLAATQNGWGAGMGASIVENVDSLNIQQPLVRDALLGLRGGSAYNCSPYMLGNVKSVYFESIQQMLGRQITPEQAMSQIQAAKEAEAG